MYKLVCCLALLIMLATLCHSFVPGDLQLREDDNIWRLSSENHGYSYPNGGGNYSVDYYYNAAYHAQPDSIIEWHSEDEYYTLRQIFIRQNYNGYYELTDNTSYDNGILINRTIMRYNLLNQLIGKYLYVFDTNTEELEYQYRHEYAYNALGNQCSDIKYFPDETIAETIESTYNSNSLLTDQTKTQRYMGQLVQYFHEERFYGQHSVPDSIHYWQNTYPIDSYTIYNTFDANGNVVYSEKHRDDTLECTSSYYVYVEQNLYLPLSHNTYKYNTSQGYPDPAGSFSATYTYSNNFRTVLQNNFYNVAQTNTATYTYNEAWKLLSASGNTIGGENWSGWSASYVWEFYSAVEDELVPSLVPTLRVYPNPCKGNAKLVYQTSKPGRANIFIYNLKGQLVNSISSFEQKAGEYSIDITGCDKAGKAMASGVYIIRVVAGTKVQSTRFLLLK